MHDVFYNEIDEYAVAWLRNLIDHGHIARGVVDGRSIEDIEPDELRRYRQCHFFAGIGVWSHALRLAGWPDDRPVWTGSCPCQPFSTAGKSTGFDDERHLWPAWHWLIEQCRPPVVFGEQVAAKAADAWIDLVQDDMEGLGYAFGAVAFPAASVGAPHIRDRCYWVADSDDARPQGRLAVRQRPDQRAARADGVAGGLADTDGGELDEREGADGPPDIGAEPRRPELRVAGPGAARGLADADGGHAGAERQQRGGQHGQQQQADGGAGLMADTQLHDGPGRLAQPQGRASLEPDRLGASGRLADDDDDAGLQRFAGLRLRSPAFHDADGRGPVSGAWADADWIPCRDDKWRPVEPGTFPLAHGAPARVGRLRAYGNAIVAPQAAEWIRTVVRCMP